MQDDHSPTSESPRATAAASVTPGNSAKQRRQELEIVRIQQTAAAEKRALTQNENRLIAALEREVELAVSLDQAVQKTRPLRAAVADDGKRRSAEIDARLGAALRERLAGKSPEEILALIDRLDDEP